MHYPYEETRSDNLLENQSLLPLN